MRIPEARAVAVALRTVRVAVKRSLKELNQSAAQRMAKGDYAAAEALVARGKGIQEFEAEVDVLRRWWKELRGGNAGTGGKDRKPVTPLWRYYQPILKAVAEAGGESRRVDFEAAVERQMVAEFVPGDLEPVGTRQVQRWRIMIRRARRPLIAEGWLAEDTGQSWQITTAGRRAADKPAKPPTGRRG